MGRTGASWPLSVRIDVSRRITPPAFLMSSAVRFTLQVLMEVRTYLQAHSSGEMLLMACELWWRDLRRWPHVSGVYWIAITTVIHCGKGHSPPPPPFPLFPLTGTCRDLWRASRSIWLQES